MKIKSIKSNPFTVHTCKYIKASVVFKDCECAFTAFADSCPEAPFGQAKTMIPASVIKKSLAMWKMCNSYGNYQCDKEIETVMERLDWIPSNVYIDLES